jgi:hypothetical protein
MQLNRRIEKLERAIGVTGECRECGGRGRGHFAMSVNGADLVPLAQPGCPSCGKGHAWKRIVLEGVSTDEKRVICALGRFAIPAV